MKDKVIWPAVLMVILASSAYARFSKFVRVAPGIEKERVSMPYSINTDPALTMSLSSNKTIIVKIPLKGMRQHQHYWLIKCNSTLSEEEQMNFRNDVWTYERQKKALQEIKQNERLNPERKSSLINLYSECKIRDDIAAIESLSISNGTAHMVLEITLPEIERTYLYRDYQNMIMDGGYYYCFDLPAYYEAFQAEPVQ